MSGNIPTRSLPKLQPSDNLPFVFPSWAEAGAFPEVHEIGLTALRDQLGPMPVELPTT